MAVRYRSKEGAVLDSFPYHQSILHSATPEYEELPGFDDEIGDCREEADLPQAARDYLGFISDFVEGADPPGRRRAGPRPDRLDRRPALAALSGIRSARESPIFHSPSSWVIGTK